MPVITSYAPGMFCWADLSTTDPARAKAFYGELFGWRLEDMPAGPDMTYTMAFIGEQTVGAMSEMSPEEKASGAPPHWNLYFSVDDVEKYTAKVEGLGGRVLMAPFDVMDVGRMSLIADPTGAVLALWQPKTHPGFGLAGEPGTVCWNELMTHDIEKAKAFYTGLFGYTVDGMDMGGGRTYTLWKLGKDGAGGALPIDPAWGPMPSNWAIYVLVQDADATLAKAVSLGAKPFMPLEKVAGVGRFTMMADPTGAAFAILEPDLSAMPG
ncbi:VOC family protein [Myxococcota bacterium]|nr:VOC family protein [Myxococcota bacterium]